MSFFLQLRRAGEHLFINKMLNRCIRTCAVPVSHHHPLRDETIVLECCDIDSSFYKVIKFPRGKEKNHLSNGPYHCKCAVTLITSICPTTRNLLLKPPFCLLRSRLSNPRPIPGCVAPVLLNQEVIRMSLDLFRECDLLVLLQQRHSVDLAIC